MWKDHHNERIIIGTNNIVFVPLLCGSCTVFTMSIFPRIHLFVCLQLFHYAFLYNYVLITVSCQCSSYDIRAEGHRLYQKGTSEQFQNWKKVQIKLLIFVKYQIHCCKRFKWSLTGLFLLLKASWTPSVFSP